MSILAIIILYTGVRFLRGSDYFSTTEKYYAIFPSVDGLTAGNPVTVSGLAIGRVDKIQLLPSRDNQVLVTLKVNNDVIIGDSTQVVISSNGLLGDKTVVLELGHSIKLFDGGDTLPSTSRPGLTENFQKAAEPLFHKLDTTAMELNIVLRDFQVTNKKIETLLETYTNTGKALNGVIADNQSNIHGITGNLNELSHSLKDSEKSFKQVLAKMNRLGDTLNNANIGRTITAANRSMENLNTMLSNINKGQGTLGKLVKNDSLYRNMNHTAESMNALLLDLKKSPKRYVHFSIFGKKAE